MIISLSGLPGTGKTTHARQLVAEDGFRLLTSTTTRPRRPSDAPGEYEYISPEEFDIRVRLGRFLWTVQVDRHQYGYDQEVITPILAEYDVVAIITPDKLDALHEIFGSRVLSFFLQAPTEDELVQRLIHRNGNHISQERIRDLLKACANWERMANIWKRLSKIPIIFIPSGSLEQTYDCLLKNIREKKQTPF